MTFPRFPTDKELEALGRLVTIAKGRTGQSKRVADFLLAWWNAADLGGFDLVHLWNVDEPIRADMNLVFVMIGSVWAYPDGNERLPDLCADIKEISSVWRAPKAKRKKR